MSRTERERVVITGIGVLAPNAHGVADFTAALREGRSGLRHKVELAELGLNCQVAGEPEGVDELAARYLSSAEQRGTNLCITYATIAAEDCWEDAGMPAIGPGSPADDETGAVFGTGLGGAAETCHDHLFPLVESGQARRLGSMVVERVMGSGPSARVSGRLGLGGPVFANSNACSTGAEAICLAADAIRSGRAARMLAGASEGYSRFIVAMFDGMRLLVTDGNDAPEGASRPLGARASGFVPAGGAAALMLESLDSARRRGARIYAEYLGGAITCGGQRGGGSMTASSPAGVRRCLQATIRDADVDPGAIDLVNGHFTGTKADAPSVEDLAATLGRPPSAFPWLTATKALIGHALGAAGAIESAAAVLMLHGQFVHGNRNCADLNPALDAYRERIPVTTEAQPCGVALKTAFGFGDVNCALLFGRWSE